MTPESPAPPPIAGTVLSLHRWPVKSMGGEPVRSMRMTRRGVGGDRAQVLFHERKNATERLTIRTVSRMLHWSAAYPDAPDDLLDPEDPPLPHLTAPDCSVYRWDDPRLPEVLAADLGRPVTLARDTALYQDLPCSILVTTRASIEALAAAVGGELDLRRFRANVHVDLDAPAFAEEGWAGRTLRVGAAELELLHPCERCVIPTRDPDTAAKHPEILRWLSRERECLFGINARVAEPSRIAVGDPVELVG